MKVIVCSPKEVIVSIDVEQFTALTGHQVGDYYGNHGTSYDKMVGKVFDLKPTLKAMYSLKVSAEVKNKVKTDLKNLAAAVETAFWPMAVIEEYKAPEVSP